MLVFIGVLEINDRLFEISIVWLVLLLAVASEMLYGVPATMILLLLNFLYLIELIFVEGFVGIFEIFVNEQYTLKSKFSGDFWDIGGKKTGSTLTLFSALQRKVTFFDTSKCLLFSIFLFWRLENLLTFCMLSAVSALVKLNIDGTQSGRSGFALALPKITSKRTHEWKKNWGKKKKYNKVQDWVN